MIWNNIKNEERLFLWKKHRDEVKGLSLETQLNEIAEFCADMPYEARTIDYYSSADWPTPWEILYYGTFCLSSISLLMFYTIRNIRQDVNIELFLIDDKEDVYLIPVIDSRLVLNYEPGSVNHIDEINDEINILKKYSLSDIKEIV